MVNKTIKTRCKHIFVLIFIYMLYAATLFFTKYASEQVFLSWKYIIAIGGAFFVLALYAVLWQQIIKRIPIAEAYMFKGTSLIWSMLFCYLFFNESITYTNLIGIGLIITGITLYNYPTNKPTEL